jgi:hypothetical protein
VSAQPLVALLYLHGQLPAARLQSRVLLLQVDFLPRVLVDFKRLGGMGQNRVPPLVIWALADLVLGVQLGYRFALAPFKDDQRLGPRVPCALVAWLTSLPVSHSVLRSMTSCLSREHL